MDEREASEPGTQGAPQAPVSVWRTALRDLALIVAGVLIALGVDQAARGYGDRQREAEYLAAVGQQVEADLAALRGHLQASLAQRDAAAKLVIAAVEGGEVSARNVVAALDRAGHVSFFAPQRAIFDDLVNTGNLRLIRDAKVRAALVSYYDVTDLNAANDVVRQEIWYRYRRTISDVLDPLVMAEVTLIEGDDTRNTLEDFAAAIPEELATSGLDLSALRENHGFRAGIGTALEYTYVQRRQHTARIARAEEVLRLLRGTNG